jgi:hypothetical protein
LVPVTVTVAAPKVAEPEAVSVSTLLLVAEGGLKLAVTPVGNPVAVRATALVNPFVGLMVTVVIQLMERLTVKLVGLAVMEKSGVRGGGTVPPPPEYPPQLTRKDARDKKIEEYAMRRFIAAPPCWSGTSFWW